MNDQIVKLAKTRSAMQAIHQDLIRCGFELEFHSVNGVEERGQNGDCSDPDCEDGTCDGGETPRDIISVKNIEVGTDASVRGGEARTVGALRPAEFLAAARALLDNYDFEIETNCSFHIHLSVPGVRHTYGRTLQAEMFAYILNNLARLPESVRERLNSESIRYCKFDLSKDKFTAIHGHPLHTWEFRLFGNITSALDGYRCLLLAIDALRHAYRARLGKTAAMATDEFTAETSKVAAKVLREKSTLQLAVRAQRLAAARRAI